MEMGYMEEKGIKLFVSEYRGELLIMKDDEQEDVLFTVHEDEETSFVHLTESELETFVEDYYGDVIEDLI